MADRDLGPIEAALKQMAFSPEGDGWRWRGRVDGPVVKIESLCDLVDQPAEAIVVPAGCSDLRAVNLRGTGSVELDHHAVTLNGPDGPVRVRFAGLAGYLLSKIAAARPRGADKDLLRPRCTTMREARPRRREQSARALSPPRSPGCAPRWWRYASGSWLWRSLACSTAARATRPGF